MLANHAACLPANYSTVTLFARLRGLWLRPALRALTSLGEVSLRRKPRNSRASGAGAFAPQGRDRHSTVTLLARFLGLSTSVPLATAV
jgi:hypothetical protein